MVEHLSPAGALELNLRLSIRDYIAEHPGATPKDITDATTVSRPVIEWHLRVLVKAGVLTRRETDADQRCVGYYLAGAVPEETRRLQLAVLRNERARRAYDVVRLSPGLNLGALARAMGVSRTTVTWHLDHLLVAGLIRTVADPGRPMQRRVFPHKPLLEASLVRLAPDVLTALLREQSEETVEEAVDAILRQHLSSVLAPVQQSSPPSLAHPVG